MKSKAWQFAAYLEMLLLIYHYNKHSRDALSDVVQIAR